jgi:sugar phosphate isomerase/epimerase
MTDISRRTLFAAGAGAAGAAVLADGAAGPAAAQAVRSGGAPNMVTRVGLPNVWGQEFLNQWSPPDNVKRDLTPGPNVIRLSGQTRPGMSNAEGTDYAAIFKRMHDEGWSAVEVWSADWLKRKVPDSEIAEIKRQLKANDIDFYNLHSAGNIIAPSPDDEYWIRHQIELIHSAEQYGCQMILSHAGSRYLSRDVAHPQNWSKESWERTVKALKRVLKETQGSKIEVAIEPVNTESINNPWAMKRLREDVGDERLMCGLDITNMVDPTNAFRMTEMINTTFDLLGDMVHYVHAKDFAWNGMLAGINWALQGTGNMDYEQFLARVSRLPTKKPVYMLVEFLTQNVEYEQAQRNIRAIAGNLGVKIHGTQPPATA